MPSPDHQPLACPSAVRSSVESTFARIAATRMAGLPICHPGLSVDALDFRDWDGNWLGVLITPWSLSLMLLPGASAAVRVLRPGQTQLWRFPSGSYEFIGHRDDTLGNYQLCSLYSPMFEFADQAEARHVARLALAALFHPDLVGTLGERELAPPRACSTTATAEPAPARRRFLRALMP